MGKACRCYVVGCLYPCWTHTHKTRQLCSTDKPCCVSFPLLQRPFTALMCKSGTCTATQSWRQAVTGGYSAAANNGKMKWGSNAIICRNTKAIFHYSRRVAVEMITGLNATRVLQLLASCNQASVERRRGETGDTLSHLDALHARRAGILDPSGFVGSACKSTMMEEVD
jgi:hypothetical protein